MKNLVLIIGLVSTTLLGNSSDRCGVVMEIIDVDNSPSKIYKIDFNNGTTEVLSFVGRDYKRLDAVCLGDSENKIDSTSTLEQELINRNNKPSSVKALNSKEEIKEGATATSAKSEKDISEKKKSCSIWFGVVCILGVLVLGYFAIRDNGDDSLYY